MEDYERVQTEAVECVLFQAEMGGRPSGPEGKS